MWKENTWFKTQTFDEFSKEFDRKKMIERVEENEKEVIKQQYKDKVEQSMYAFCNEFSIDTDFTYCENASDCWIEASIYVDNLLWKNRWYNVIVDVEAKTRFESVEEFADYMIETEQHSQKIYKHFNSSKKNNEQ